MSCTCCVEVAETPYHRSRIIYGEEVAGLLFPRVVKLRLVLAPPQLLPEDVLLAG